MEMGACLLRRAWRLTLVSLWVVGAHHGRREPCWQVAAMVLVVASLGASLGVSGALLTPVYCHAVFIGSKVKKNLAVSG